MEVREERGGCEDGDQTNLEDEDVADLEGVLLVERIRLGEEEQVAALEGRLHASAVFEWRIGWGGVRRGGGQGLGSEEQT